MTADPSMDLTVGREIHALAQRLWPINRSLTGDGVRETLAIIQELLPNLVVSEVASGTQVFDWTVPREWSVTQAHILTPDGRKICDFAENNLHLVGYSVPVRTKLQLDELQHHLFSDPQQPDAIPYVTSYYAERWGFCLAHRERERLTDGTYEVVVDTKLFDGSLTYAELIIPGRTEKEVFLSTYICHPSMANNELSGPTVTTYLARWLLEQGKLEYTYRIVFIPETLGAIVYLSRHLNVMKHRVIAGFNVSCIGDDRAYSYLPTRMGDTLSDNVAKHILKWTDNAYKAYSWRDRGSDERQYCAPGVDLPVASIMRSKYAEYPEYHTSLDNLTDVVTPEGLEGGYRALRRAIEAIERNVVPRVTVLGEPQLGPRGLYPTLSSKGSAAGVATMMDLISWCDGRHSLLEIAELIERPIWALYEILDTLKSNGLIELLASKEVT